MTDDSSFREFVAQRQIHDLVVQRVVEHVFDRPLINNVERGSYIECFVELAMKGADPRWCLTTTWDSWDIEHHASGARIEVKQSSALQSWHTRATGAKGTRGSFGIEPHDNYWWGCPDGEYHTMPTDLHRYADVYIFAWHREPDRIFADHRQASQWQFFVVSEHRLPDQKSISLNPLRDLVEPCDYRTLAGKVTRAVSNLPRLKVEEYPPPQQCPWCSRPS